MSDYYCPKCEHDFCMCHYETERQELIDLLDINCGYVAEEEAYILADRLIRHGYHKQSDTVRGFVEELYKKVGEYRELPVKQLRDMIKDLAKEYGVEE